MTDDPIERSLERAEGEREGTLSEKRLLWIVIIGLAIVFAITIGYILLKAKGIGGH